MDIGAQLSAFARTADPTAAALDIARCCLFDWAVCALAGVDEPVSEIMRAQAAADAGAAQSSVAGLAGFRVPARAAALANGAISHALDYDDTHFAHIGHPSVVVMPAVLALAERHGVAGRDVLRAALVGAEASVRIGQWLGEPHADAGFHTTATAGVFGAGLASAALLDLDEERILTMLGLLTSYAAGLKAQFGTMAKPLHAGQAAAAGVATADLAAAGFVANPGAFDGPLGFGAAYRGVQAPRAFAGLGAEWRMEEITFKFHACCHGLHAMLEAVSDLRLEASELDRLTIRTHPRWMQVCAIEAPKTGLEAKFSYRMAAALRIAGRDTARPDTFSDDVCGEPLLLEVRERVSVVPDPTLPHGVAIVDVTASGARSHQVRRDATAVLPREVRRTRLLSKARAVLGPARARALADAVLGEEPDIARLAEFLRAAT